MAKWSPGRPAFRVLASGRPEDGKECRSRAARVSRAAPDFLLHASSAKTALWRPAVPVPLGSDTRPVRRTSSWCAGFSLGPRRGDRDIMGTAIYALIESWLSETLDAPYSYSFFVGGVQKCSALFITVSRKWRCRSCAGLFSDVLRGRTVAICQDCPVSASLPRCHGVPVV
jgi:hypothetical protein